MTVPDAALAAAIFSAFIGFPALLAFGRLPRRARRRFMVTRNGAPVRRFYRREAASRFYLAQARAYGFRGLDIEARW